MARAKGQIAVDIIGDASDLQRAAKDSNKAIGGIGKAAKGLGAALVAGFAVDTALDFAQTALGEADRVGDATARLEAQLGDLADPLTAATAGFEKLGQSRQDVLELEARFTDLGKAAHLSNAEIANAAPSAVEAAAALALLGIGGGDANAVLDLIGKAAGGASKPLKELGVDLSTSEVQARAMADTGKTNAKALSDQELAAARFELIMEKLAPQISAVTDGSADLEQKQSELQAKFETLTGRIGEGLEGPLTGLLDWILSGIDGLGELDQFIGFVEQSLRDALGPVADLRDALEGLLDTIGDALAGLAELLAPHDVRLTSNGGRVVGSPSNVTVTVQGGSPEVIEQAVKKAIVHAANTGPRP